MLGERFPFWLCFKPQIWPQHWSHCHTERSLAWLCCTGANPTSHSCARCSFELLKGGSSSDALLNIISAQLRTRGCARGVAHPHLSESLLQFSSHPFTPSWLSQGLVNLRCHCCVGGTCFIPAMSNGTCWVLSGWKLPRALLMWSCCKMGCWTLVLFFFSSPNRSQQQLPVSSLLSSPCQLCELLSDGYTQTPVPALCFAVLGNK